MISEYLNYDFVNSKRFFGKFGVESPKIKISHTRRMRPSQSLVNQIQYHLIGIGIA